MNDSLYPIQELIPLTQITEDNIKRIRIGEDFVDLARLGMIGEYQIVDYTALCPKLYYRWNYQYGIWEIYATEHDLIRYNLIGVSGLRSGSIPPTPGPEPGPEPGPGPTPDPEPEPDDGDYVVKLSSTDSNWTFNGAIMTFSGIIRWYPELEGHYVPVTFKIGQDYLQYMDSLIVTYRGAKYDKSIFTNGEVTLHISVRVPGQMVPIRFDFTEGLHTQYFIKIDPLAIFQEPDGTIPPIPDSSTPEDSSTFGDSLIDNMPEVTKFLRGFKEGSTMLDDYIATDQDIINMFKDGEG